MKTFTVGIIGDYNHEFISHPSTGEAIRHAARALGVHVETDWVPTPELERKPAADVLRPFDGFWISSGAPYQSFQGALAGIKYARTSGKPFTAT